MLVYTAPSGIPHSPNSSSSSSSPLFSSSLFPSSIPSVKAYSALGPDHPYELEFSSLSHSAPLLYLNPADPVTCPRCCESFSPSTSLSLSPQAAALVANKTVVLVREDIESCRPAVNLFSGFETMHLSLGRGGVRAVVFVSREATPGELRLKRLLF